MRNFVDSIFSPVSDFMYTIKTNLLRYAIERNRPIDLDSFFAPFALLGPHWVTMIKFFSMSVFAITMIFIAIAVRGVYLYFKEGVKFW